MAKDYAVLSRAAAIPILRHMMRRDNHLTVIADYINGRFQCIVLRIDENGRIDNITHVMCGVLEQRLTPSGKMSIPASGASPNQYIATGAGFILQMNITCERVLL